MNVLNQTIIELENLRKEYRSGEISVAALQGVSFAIAENEFIAIMGPSGSGKSTLMNILGCLDQPSSGRYHLGGREVSTMSDDELAAVRNRDIGFVFQSFHLLPRLNIVRNVMLPLKYSDIDPADARQRARDMLARVNLENRLEHVPNELSGGQRQRVAIARALVNRPKIIFADEPTGNLDSKTSVEIMELFSELHRAGQTIILVTHEPEIAEYAQKVIHMRDGQIEKVEINASRTV
ncbi:ABC transporter ATP-binding protein [uncultured Gilvimarinus sp.]|uniref:ABC transporter ATP-binding protein n=1 Tax=uncultured Gilvimarinus sp. TaxID=1689143 RepID=UPI0030DD5E93